MLGVQPLYHQPHGGLTSGIPQVVDLRNPQRLSAQTAGRPRTTTDQSDPAPRNQDRRARAVATRTSPDSQMPPQPLEKALLCFPEPVFLRSRDRPARADLLGQRPLDERVRAGDLDNPKALAPP